MSDPSEVAALERCVGDVGRFISVHWGRTPLFRARTGARGFDDLLSMDDVDRMLSTQALRLPAFRLVKDGSPLPPSSYTRTARTGSTTIAGVADPARVYRLFFEGATIVLQGLQRFWPPLTRFCRELDEALGHPTQVNAYVTPPDARGLGVHSDSHDVFVLQVFGSKRWDVGEPASALELRPGDTLYMPEGTAHSASAQETMSGHLTIGILTTRWSRVLRAAMELLELDPRFGERLPVAYHRDPEAFGAAVKLRLGEIERLMSELDAAEVAEAVTRGFLTSRPSLLRGALHDLAALEGLHDESLLRRRPGASCHVAHRRDRLAVFLGDRELRMPSRLEPAMRFIEGREAFRVRDLAGVLDEGDRSVLVRRLVREGLLEVAVANA